MNLSQKNIAQFHNAKFVDIISTSTVEYVTKVHAVCTKTRNLAHYSHRIVQNDNLVLLGEVQEYEPLSRAAYFKAMQKNTEEKALKK